MEPWAGPLPSLPRCNEPCLPGLGASDTSVAASEASDVEPAPRDRANTWPSLHPGLEEAARKKAPSRAPNSEPAAKKPNPWGDESYAELIARAIGSAPAHRMKLSEIYAWFVDNNPYFAERKDVEAAAGWKVPLPSYPPVPHAPPISSWRPLILSSQGGVALDHCQSLTLILLLNRMILVFCYCFRCETLKLRLMGILGQELGLGV